MSDLILHDDGSKIVLVGQAPSRATDGFPPFSGMSGRRLEEVSGLAPGKLPERFALFNVLERWPGPAAKGDKFPIHRARKAAKRLLFALEGRRVVAIGRAVAKVLGVPPVVPDMVWSPHDKLAAIAVLPHPSGVNLWWNDPGNKAAAAAFMRSLCAG